MAKVKRASLSEKHKAFIRAIVCDKMLQGEAYRKIYGNIKSADSKASKLLKRASIIAYYEKVSKGMEEKDVSKALWNREKATYHLLWLLEVAKEDILNYGLNRANILAAINSAKELDRIYGLKGPSESLINAPQIFFVGEEKIAAEE